MECSLALCFKDFAMLATDKTSARSIMVMKDGEKRRLKSFDYFVNSFYYNLIFRLQQGF